MLTLINDDKTTELLDELPADKQQGKLQKVVYGQLKMECRCHPGRTAGRPMGAYASSHGKYFPRRKANDGPLHHTSCPRHAFDAHELATWGWTPDVLRQSTKAEDRVISTLDTSLQPLGLIDEALPDTTYRLPDQERTIVVKRRATLLGLLRLAWARGRLTINDPNMPSRTNPWERLRVALTKIEISGIADSPHGLSEITLFSSKTNNRIARNNHMAIKHAYGRRRVMLVCLLSDRRVNTVATDEEFDLGEIFGTRLDVPNSVARKRASVRRRLCVAEGRSSHGRVRRRDRQALWRICGRRPGRARSGHGPADSGDVQAGVRVLHRDHRVPVRLRAGASVPDCDILDSEFAHYSWEVYVDRDDEYRRHKHDKEVRFDEKVGANHGYWRVDIEDLRAALARFPHPRPGVKRLRPFPF